MPPPAPKKSFKMPTVEEFLRMKQLRPPRRKPVWVYLDEEMKEKERNNIKPYNWKVGIWIRFLKELHLYNRCLQKRIMRRLTKECGPVWYLETSSHQKEILAHLPESISSAILTGQPNRVKVDLWNMGMTLKIPSHLIMNAILNCELDSGVFLWILYTHIYGMPPSVPRKSYDINAKILMSALVSIDIDELIDDFNRLTYVKPVIKPPKPKKVIQKKMYNGPFALYLQRPKVPECLGKNKQKTKRRKPPKVQYKFKLRSQKSFERLRMNEDFLELRRQSRTVKKPVLRECHYKFYRPPVTAKGLDPAKGQVVMLEARARSPARMTAKHLLDINKYHVGAVAMRDYKNRYVIEGITCIPNQYLHIEAGGAFINQPPETFVKPIISGHAKYLRPPPRPRKCQCLQYEKQAMDYLMNTKCTCGHFYDYGHNKRMRNAAELDYFHPPNRHGPMRFDDALIYQMDPTEQTINVAIEHAVASQPTSLEESSMSLLVEDLKPKVVIAILLADLSKTPRIIPHLPLANELHSLLSWVRKRVHGKLTPEEDKALLIRSERRWYQIEQLNFRARAYRIPFTREQIDNMTWNERKKLQRLFKTLLQDFTTRNRLLQLEQSRLWWSYTEYDEYPGKAFLDAFHTLAPGGRNDTYLNPHFLTELRPYRPPKPVPKPFT